MKEFSILIVGMASAFAAGLQCMVRHRSVAESTCPRPTIKRVG